MPRWPGRLLTGGITCCTLVPISSIPFEVVCLIGMNDDTFPRARRSLSFDRMAQDVHRGDRSRRDDDRYLFLEALLSARRCLYISYVGRHIRENSILPPSLLVSELLDTIARGCYPSDQPLGDVRMRVVIDHPLQPFSRRYFTQDTTLFSYATDLCEAGRRAGRGRTRPAPLVTNGLPEPGDAWQTVEVRDLLAFFRHPVRCFLQRRLGIYLEAAEGSLETREPFTLAPLSRYQLLQEVLQHHLAGESPDRILSLVRAAGFLPQGQVGVTLFEREWPAVEAFAARLAPFLAAHPPVTVEVDLRVGDRSVIGQLDHVRPQGLLGYCLGKTRGRHYLEMWIRHLVLNCLAPEGIECTSQWLAEDAAFTLPPLRDAQTYLQHLLAWYWQGLHQPLHLYPESALAYAQAFRQPEGDPLAAARQTWESSDHHHGEDDDAYYQLAFREHDPLDHEFTQATEAVFGTLLAFV
jgi:exodeoxyribonuclease V gamma subunit